ncbi:MAG: flagellar hook-basal body complex protein FliE [Alphaproteobacteria bacterium]|nr:flagellar hook-basal body complex protein FliE [Alphaproteobacteria bacterium]MDD9919421.1 flagellar hook-basal body complex protein FliE [Alphaproteobacteria bacterium]
MDFKTLGTLPGLGTIGTLGDTGKTQGEQTHQAFGDLVKQAVGNVVETQKNAESLAVAAAEGEDIPMHQVIQAVSEAELTLQTMVTVRDKTIEAYQEILRMPI